MNVQYEPLDVTKLEKGQTIHLETLEPILRIPRNHPLWGLGLVRLKHKITVTRSRLGLPLLTMRCHRGELIICDDSDAAKYNASMTKRGVRRIRCAAARNAAVDIRNLTDEEKREHERTQARQAMFLVAARNIFKTNRRSLTDGQRAAPAMITQ